MRNLFLLGRAIFGGYFIYNGINHILHEKEMAGYAASKGTPAADAAVLASGTMLVAGGLSIVAGLRPRQGLAMLIAFLVPVSVQMHKFWEAEDPGQRQTELVNFTKNMALVGAALMLMEIREPWRASAENARRRIAARYPENFWQAGVTTREFPPLPA